MIPRKLDVRPAASVLFTILLSACPSDDGQGDEAGDSLGSDTADTGETADTGDTGETVDCSMRPIDIPKARGEIEAIWDSERERMLFFGGDQGTPISCMSQTDFVAEVWAFHPDCDNFQQLQPDAGMPARGRHALALDKARGWALIHGGRYRAGTSGDYTVYDDLWAFDLATESWTMLAAGGPSGRSNHVAAVFGNYLLVYGGNSSNNGLSFTPLGDTWVYDLAGAGGWTQLPTSNDPEARLFHAAAASDSTLYVFGGGDENAFTGPFFGDLWALDVASGAWTLLDGGGGNDKPISNSWADLLYDGAGNRLLLWSGHEDSQLGNNNAVWAYDLGGGGWSQLEIGDVYNAPANGFCDFPADFVVPDLAAPERRNAGAAVLDDGGNMLIFGGKTDCGLINDVWSWSLAESSWQERSPATSGEICLRASAMCQTMCF